MLKIIYRIIILIAVFAASIYYFSKDIKEVVFDFDNTTIMEETTYPLVVIQTGDQKINLLHAYSSNLNANSIREAVTPLKAEQSFEVIINQEAYVIKKMNYELREFNGNELIETNSVSVFNEDGNIKSAKIKLQTELETGKEYAVKITLITSESKKMYFYHRVKRYENAYLSEKLSFIMDFHNAIKDKDSAQSIAKYLEPKKSADNTSFSRVNINSSFDLITWGNLKPVYLTEIIPTIMEIYSDTASVELKYIIEAEIAGAKELFQVNEFYRVRYTKDRMYLLNYERSMEAFFDPELISVSQNQLKLGITSDYEVPYLASDDHKKLAFVRNRELWYYNLTDNEMVRIFSFRQDNTDYIRDIYDQHDIRILNMSPEGDIDFLVYGYMNRGQYEGRVAFVLYRYIRGENRIEEMVYIPVEEPYQKLKMNIGDLAYVNSLDVFYFNIYNSIYSYDMITHQLQKLSDNVERDEVVVLKDIDHVAWQGHTDPALSKEIKIMNLETGELWSINSEPGYNIILLDKIDSNLIYGYAPENNTDTLIDGRTILPMDRVEIASTDKKVLKKYSKSGYHITDVKVKDNILELDRIIRGNDYGRIVYTNAPKDYIMNQVKAAQPVISTITRVTEQALTEGYMTLPKGIALVEKPKLSRTVNTIIFKDPTLRLPVKEDENLYYYPYVIEGISGAYKEASEAIEIARDRMGVVLDSRNRLVWERGIKANKFTISRFEDMTWSVTTDKTVETCIRLMLSYQGINIGLDKLKLTDNSIYGILSEHGKNAPVRLTGITLDDALYYVSEGRPVLAMTNQRDAVLIYGYDTFNILVIDPKSGQPKKIGLQDSTELFNAAGNVFISYHK